MIEYRIDHSCLIPFDKGSGDIGIFGDDHSGRHITAMRKLIGSRAQRGAQNRIDAL
jgi:hypothetical protein